MRCFITNRDCKFERLEPRDLQPTLKFLPEHSIFMISPFGFPFDDLFRHGISATINRTIGKKLIAGPETIEVITRADQALQLGYVMCQRICRKILEAEWAFVDVTEPNANVYYELGLAYGKGRRIVLLSSARSSNPYINSLRGAGDEIPMLQYSGLECLKNPQRYEDCLGRAFRISDEDKRGLEPQSILEAGRTPTILNVQAADNPFLDLHCDSIKWAIGHYNASVGGEEQLADWSIDSLEVGTGTDLVEAARHIQNAKICLFDVTQLGERPNAAIFFLLGVAHATEREVIPIVNQPLSRSIPFDIRGLWQVNYQKAEQLRDELEQILPRIDADFKRDRQDHPYRQVWEPFLRHREVHVFTCAREMLEDKDRGPRTDIDLWDFKSVSALSLFIAQKYESAKVHLDPPRNKPRLGELRRMDLDKFHQVLLGELHERDCVIIGSPDVSDYAEVVLSRLYGIAAHRQPKRGTKLPFRFTKATIAKDHPRRISAFYRLPDIDSQSKHDLSDIVFGKVEFNGRVVECVRAKRIVNDVSVVSGTTYAVITIAKWPPDHHIMVISGFTGIATFAAMRLLTDPKIKPELTRFLERQSAERPGSSPGVNILVSVDFTQPDPTDLSGDRREPTGVAFVDMSIIPA